MLYLKQRNDSAHDSIFVFKVGRASACPEQHALGKLSVRVDHVKVCPGITTKQFTRGSNFGMTGHQRRCYDRSIMSLRVLRQLISCFGLRVISRTLMEV